MVNLVFWRNWLLYFSKTHMPRCFFIVSSRYHLCSQLVHCFTLAYERKVSGASLPWCFLHAKHLLVLDIPRNRNIRRKFRGNHYKSCLGKLVGPVEAESAQDTSCYVERWTTAASWAIKNLKLATFDQLRYGTKPNTWLNESDESRW